MKIPNLLPWAAAALLSGTFLYAGTLKVLEPHAFVSAIWSFGVVPAALVNPVALAIPWLEITCGALLWTRRYRQASTFLLGALCVVFALLLGYSALLGRQVDCGCFGKNDPLKHSPAWAIGRDALLAAAAGYLFLRERRR